MQRAAASAGRGAARMFSATKLHADDTPVPVLARRGKMNRACGLTFAMIVPRAMRRRRLCGLPTRPIAGANTRNATAHFKGVLYDAFAGFAPLYPGHNPEAACWAHVRRKFYDLHKAQAHPGR